MICPYHIHSSVLSFGALSASHVRVVSEGRARLAAMCTNPCAACKHSGQYVKVPQRSHHAWSSRLAYESRQPALISGLGPSHHDPHGRTCGYLLVGNSLSALESATSRGFYAFRGSGQRFHGLTKANKVSMKYSKPPYFWRSGRKNKTTLQRHTHPFVLHFRPPFVIDGAHEHTPSHTKTQELFTQDLLQECFPLCLALRRVLRGRCWPATCPPSPG